MSAPWNRCASTLALTTMAASAANVTQATLSMQTGQLAVVRKTGNLVQSWEKMRGKKQQQQSK